jgi:hypothetical protein
MNRLSETVKFTLVKPPGENFDPGNGRGDGFQLFSRGADSELPR